jgi:hypothetical protein
MSWQDGGRSNRAAVHQHPLLRLQQAAGNAATASALLQRDLMAFGERRAQPTATGTRFHSADGPGIRDALEPLVNAGKVTFTVKGAEYVFSNQSATTAELASALASAGYDRAQDMAKALADPHNVSVYTGEEVRKTKFSRSKRQSQIERLTKRGLTQFEAAAARRVFGSALKLDSIVLSEGGLMTVGGYARTMPDRIYFPADAFNHGNFRHWLIHELTHVWQYQRGAELPGMIFEALVGNYDYGGEAGLRKAWDDGKAFDEFTTEQQGDILADYYVRLVANLDVSAYQGFVDQVRAGKEKEHRYKTVEPLEAGKLDVAKINEAHRTRVEAEIISQLELAIRADDNAAIARRKRRVLELFRQLLPYWSEQFRERIRARRSGDRLVTLLFTRLSGSTRKKIFDMVGGI